MSLGCARCGDCCEELYLPTGKIYDILAQIRHGDPANRVDERMRADALFINEHWTEIAPSEGDPSYTRYECDRFDPDTRQCTAYDERPPVCQNFPFYGRTPEEAAERGFLGATHPRCSYWLDVAPEFRREDARPLIPLEVLRG